MALTMKQRQGSKRSVSYLRARLSKLKGEKKMALVDPGMIGQWISTTNSSNLNNPNNQATYAISEVDQLRVDLETLKEAHLNIAKNQEERISELESVVTELMDFMKEQQKRIDEDTKKKSFEEQDKIEQLQRYAAAAQSSYGYPMTTPQLPTGLATAIPASFQGGVSQNKAQSQSGWIQKALGIQP